MKRYAFPRKMRLSHSASINKAFKQRSLFQLGVRLFVVKNSCEHNRYLFTFRRNFATAVKRNHIKRVCREVLRHMNPKLLQGYDLIFLFTDTTIEISVLKNPFDLLLRRAGLFDKSFV